MTITSDSFPEFFQLAKMGDPILDESVMQGGLVQRNPQSVDI